MRTIYHVHESLDHLMATRLLPGGEDEPVRVVVFGGTGAVGGAVVLELCKRILRSRRFRDRPLRGEIYATGLADKEISLFAGRLYRAAQHVTSIEKIEPLRHYRIDGRIDLHFDRLGLVLPSDLPQRIRDARDAHAAAHGDRPFDLAQACRDYFDAQPRPLLGYIEGIGQPLNAVVVSIPLPSVAAYTLELIDGLVEEYSGADAQLAQRIKARALRVFVGGLAVVQQRYARQVLIAHTTAVGGMYRVDDGEAEIRLGFAHSARGQKMVDKKYFADKLTNLYLDRGFDVLVTAAAIGIDAVEENAILPLDRAARRMLQTVVDEWCSPDPPPFPADDLDKGHILLYPARGVPLAALPPDDAAAPLRFDAGKELRADAVIRSGENGLFSVANCVALYNVMKVAIAEELAMVLVRRALFGPERRADWFRDKVCYYDGTENAHFALRLLDNHPRLARCHYDTFAVQSYQALGSATHQARLHELGLINLLLRLDDLAADFAAIPETTLEKAVTDLDAFFRGHTQRPAWEDLARYCAESAGLEGIHRLAERLGRLCAVRDLHDVGRLIGYDPRARGAREPGREKFLARLATAIQRYVATITSLGIPIVYRAVDGPDAGQDRMLLGPYVAPLETGIGRQGDVYARWHALAQRHGVAVDDLRDWTIVNNGFVDLRPHALVTDAPSAGPDLGDRIARFAHPDEVAAWLDALRAGSYFTTAGLVATTLRLRRLFAQVCRRQLALGTLETWKHLFPEDEHNRFLLAPGLIETARMYSEGVGKITGTEALWPSWGY
ncbi:MAG: hypothetical protein AAF772_10925 [Acidobacteriota bacterium]